MRAQRIVFFVHSLVSDWNHGNAHFLRGVVSELLARGHDVQVLEPENAWSRQNLIQDHGEQAATDYLKYYPGLRSTRYAALDLNSVLAGADLIIVHEWNEPDLISDIGAYHTRNPGPVLLFHDTHHRFRTDQDWFRRLDLSGYDGVLAYGKSLALIYRQAGLNASVWHEAADTRVFRPLSSPYKWDCVWVGNWGDGERSHEINEFLVQPIRKLGLAAAVYGVRYPDEARAAMKRAGIKYCGWLPNYRVPEIFASARFTIHVPRRAYQSVLSGIPTIRPFEALACGIPLISAPWRDVEKLFRVGEDFLIAENSAEMMTHIEGLLGDSSRAQQLKHCGLETVRSRHTCSHRVDELMRITDTIRKGFSLRSRWGEDSPMSSDAKPGSVLPTCCSDSVTSTRR